MPVSHRLVFGVAICVGALVYYWRKTRRRSDPTRPEPSPLAEESAAKPSDPALDQEAAHLAVTRDRATPNLSPVAPASETSLGAESSTALPSLTAAFRCLTYNIRHTADRYDERYPFLTETFAVANADIAGLQEVDHTECQAELLGSCLPHMNYEVSNDAPSDDTEGNSVLVGGRASNPRLGDFVDLGQDCTAQRVLVDLETGTDRAVTAWIVNLHLVFSDDPDDRLEQITATLQWLSNVPEHADVMFMMGDFNAPPHEPTYPAIVSSGFVSSYCARHGAEPDFTWPSGIVCDSMDTAGDPGCFDYIWFKTNPDRRIRVEVTEATVLGNKPWPMDSTLYPSDHFAIAASFHITKDL